MKVLRLWGQFSVQKENEKDTPSPKCLIIQKQKININLKIGRLGIRHEQMK
jgi:hypothetical protein